MKRVCCLRVVKPERDWTGYEQRGTLASFTVSHVYILRSFFFFPYRALSDGPRDGA